MGTGALRRQVLMVLPVLATLAGCGEDRESWDAEAWDEATEPGDSGSPGKDPTDSDPLRDVATEGPGDESPESCPESMLCNAMRTGEGGCPGECHPWPHGLVCDGVVRFGVCFQRIEPLAETGEERIGSIRIIPEAWPRYALVGERSEVRIRFRNEGITRVRLPLVWRPSPFWEVTEVAPEGLRELDLIPQGESEAIFRLRALAANVLVPPLQEVLTLSLGEEGTWRALGAVGFASGEHACGGYLFPARWALCEECSTWDRYETGVCCDGVFFPGAWCCTDRDCLQGACIDGRCVPWAPFGAVASALPIGPHRALFVLADQPDFPEIAGPCGGPNPEWEEALDLARVTGWFNDRSEARFGRRPLAVQWRFVSGVNSEAFIHRSEDWIFSNYADRFEEWIRGLGCPGFEDFDLIVLTSPRMDLAGAGGQAFTRGRIAAETPRSPWLLVHEMAHVFGASDLYLDLAGTTWAGGALMANGWGWKDPPDDRVAWGEMGWADLDGDGVVDLMSHCESPETLELQVLMARLTPKETLEVELAIGGVEGGRPCRVVVPEVAVELPASGARAEVRDLRWRKPVVFDASQADLKVIEQQGRVEVRIVAERRVTTWNWQRVQRTLDVRRTVRVLPAEVPADGGAR